MDENLSRGYVQLGKARGINEFKLSNGFNHISPPADNYQFIRMAFIVGGIGFLLPYNSFIIAVDYFQARYPGTTVIFDMSLVYILMAFFAVFANNILVETLSLNTRITFGYLVSFVTLNFVLLCEIWWESFGVATSYTINLIAVAVVSLGCTVQQSSFYGYTSMLPIKYTQAVMIGESLAGLCVSFNRITTKFLLPDERSNTSVFFAFSNITIFICFLLHQVVRKTDFVQFYINLCQERNRITLEPSEDVGLDIVFNRLSRQMDPLEQVGDPTRGQYGVLKLQTSPLGTESTCGSADVNGAEQCSAFSFSNPVYEPGAPSGNPPGSAGPTYKVEDVVVMRGTYSNQGSKPWSSVKKGLLARLEVAKLIKPYMASIGIAYFVTLCLYPGIMSEIISCKLRSWMPVILMHTFNAADLCGKLVASLPYEWKRKHLLYFSTARSILIPMFLLCVIPRGNAILSNDHIAFVLSLLLGLSNGIVGSIPIIQAPSKVQEENRELAGNIMTLSYISGLTLGSVVAYIIEIILGPSPSADEVCPKPSEPFSTIQPFNNSTMVNVLTSTVMSSTLSSVIEKTTSTMATLKTTSSFFSTLSTTSPFVSNVTVASNILTTSMSKDWLNSTTQSIGNSIWQH